MADATTSGIFDAGTPGVQCFYTTYANGEASAYGPCTTARNLLLCEPTASGSYPAFVWVGGTTSNFDGITESVAISQMAARGYIAVSPEYSGSASMGSHLPKWVAGAQKKYMATATCLFSPSIGSALATACSWDDASGGVRGDCSQGSVVSGDSQGGMLAIASKNVNSDIVAAVAYAAAPPMDPDEEPYSEFLRLDGGRAFDDHHLRAAVGANDQFNSIWIGGSGEPDGGTAVIANALNALTGLSCPIYGTSASNTNCLRSDGSGWVIPYPGNLTPPNPAKHTFMVIGTCSLKGCPPLDPLVWSPEATGPWGLETSLAWLDQVRRNDL